MSEGRRSVVLAGALFALAVAATLAISWVIGATIARDDGWERSVLDAMNPDRPLPLLDLVVVAMTDASGALYWVVLIWLGFASAVQYRVPRFRRVLVWLTLILGGALAAVALFVDWPGTRGVGLMALSALIAFGIVAFRLHVADGAGLRRYLRLVGVTLLIAFPAMLVVDRLLDRWIDRPRPLSEAHLEWNDRLRVVQGEQVVVGRGFISGHASQQFALLTPLALYLVGRRRYLYAALVLVWATLHAWTRLYVAAHFPTDVIVGSIDGFVIGALAFFLFYREQDQ